MLEAATAEVYDFDSTLRGVSQQDILNGVTRQSTSIWE